MELQLKNKNALVTGGTRGIGRAIVESLAAEGANIAFCARRKNEVDETLTHFKKNYPVDMIAESVDISQPEVFTQWINHSAKELGGIDILILNAAAMASENNIEDWQANFNVDLMAAMTATNIAYPYLEQAAKKHGDASIILISSVSALETDSLNSYGPIKAALIHVTKGLAKEYGQKRIRSNAISPGPIYFQNGYWHDCEKNDPDTFQKVLKKIPLQRMGKPEDVANATLFLASPVSSFISGGNLIIDGAYTSRIDF